MTRIVHEEYPVSRLPKDLRDEIAGSERVRLTLEPVAARAGAPTLEDIFEKVRALHEQGEIQPLTAEEAVARVRALRDEWDG